MPGWVGAPAMLTARVCELELPQVLPAVTITVPPLAPATVLMDMVVLVPVHPPGKVQV